MLQTWIWISFLALESHQVMWLRSLRLMSDDRRATQEVVLMATEKVEAAQKAAWQIACGATPESIIGGYRSLVRANRIRLAS